MRTYLSPLWRSNGLGCAGRDCTTCPSRGMGACAMGAMTPADAHWSADPDSVSGMGAILGPDALEDFLTQLESTIASFASLETDLLATQRRLLDAIRQAEAKRQGKLVNEAESANRKLVELLSRYRSTRDTLNSYLTEVRQTKAAYANGQIGWIGVAASTARLGFQLPFAFNNARQLLIDAPRFSQSTMALIERINGAPVLGEGVVQTVAQIPANLATLAMWAAIGAGIIVLGPKLMPKRRTT